MKATLIEATGTIRIEMSAEDASLALGALSFSEEGHPEEVAAAKLLYGVLGGIVDEGNQWRKREPNPDVEKIVFATEAAAAPGLALAHGRIQAVPDVELATLIYEVVQDAADEIMADSVEAEEIASWPTRAAGCVRRRLLEAVGHRRCLHRTLLNERGGWVCGDGCERIFPSPFEAETERNEILRARGAGG